MHFFHVSPRLLLLAAVFVCLFVCLVWCCVIKVTEHVSVIWHREGGGGGVKLGRVREVHSCQNTLKNAACTAFQGEQEPM